MHNITSNHPQKELAKFGYTSEMKVEKLKNPVIFFGNLLELIVQIWRFPKTIPQNLATSALFSQKSFA